MERVLEIASQTSTPIALAGFLAAALFFTIRKMIGAGIFPALSQTTSGKGVKLIILQLRNAGKLLGGFKTRSDIVRWNTTYEMTVDDLSFLCGFLVWYIASLGQEDLTSNQAYSLGWDAASGVFATEHEAASLNMRYFTYEGKPILEYVDYLGLID